METYTIARPDICYPGLDLAKIHPWADPQQFWTAATVMLVPANSLAVCADGSMLSLGANIQALGLGAENDYRAPETINVTRRYTKGQPFLVAVSPQHPHDQRIVGVLVATWLPHQKVERPLFHTHVIRPRRPHYCGAFSSADVAASFILAQMAVPAAPLTTD